MKLFKKKGILGSAGLSLVELLISMAILAVVGTAIGGAMYVSSRSYTRGSSEVNVQEEAQVASNLISDWLLDATSVTQTSTSNLTIVHPEGNDTVEIFIRVSGGNLVYDAKRNGTAFATDQILASYVTGVAFNSTFDTDRNVKISMDFKVNDRTYHSVTDSTSRNQDFISTSGGSSGGRPIISFDIAPVSGHFYVMLEPGMNATTITEAKLFTFKTTVYGVDPADLELSVDNGGSLVPIGSSSWTDVTLGDCPIKVKRDADDSCVYTVQCSSSNTAHNGGDLKFTATNVTNSLSDTKQVTIAIRRVNDINFTSHELAFPGGEDAQGKLGCEYPVMNLNLNVQNEASFGSANFDRGLYAYKDPTVINYYYRMKVGSNYVDASSYVNAVEVKTGLNPSVQIKLAADLPDDLYVIAVATHSGSLAAGSTPYNVTFPDATLGEVVGNKVTAITGTGFTYTGSVAEWDWFKIAKGTGGSPNIVNVGSGFQRGSSHFKMGELSDAAYQEVMAYMNSHGGITNFKFVCSFKYEPVDHSSPLSPLNVLNVYGGSGFKTDYGLWGTNGTSGNQTLLTSLFDCDKSYKVYVYFDLIDTRTWTSVKQYTGEGTLNAVEQYVYDTNNKEFINTDLVENVGGTDVYAVGSINNPLTFSRNHPAYNNTFYVHYDSLNSMNNAPYRIESGCYTVYKYKGTGDKSLDSSWELASKQPTVQGWQNEMQVGEDTVHLNPWSTNSEVAFHGTTDTKIVGNYDQNIFPDEYITTVKNECSSYQSSETGEYKIVYTTKNNGKRGYVSNRGAMPSASNANGIPCVISQNSSSSQETLGTVYYNITN